MSLERVNVCRSIKEYAKLVSISFGDLMSLELVICIYQVGVCNNQSFQSPLEI